MGRSPVMAQKVSSAEGIAEKITISENRKEERRAILHPIT